MVPIWGIRKSITIKKPFRAEGFLYFTVIRSRMTVIDNKGRLLAFFALGLYTAGASFNALAVKDGVLQVRKQTSNRSSHTVGAFYGSGVNFTANCAHSWHRS